MQHTKQSLSNLLIFSVKKARETKEFLPLIITL